MKTKTNPKPSTETSPIRIIKSATCPSLSGKSTIGYDIGLTPENTLSFAVTHNSGGGFFSDEWVSLKSIQSAISNGGSQLTSLIFRPLFRGKSVNTHAFLTAVLINEGLLKTLPKHRRLHEPCDPESFLLNMEKLLTGVAKEAHNVKTSGAKKSKTGSVSKVKP